MASLIPPGRAHWVISPYQAAADFVAGYRGSTRKSYGLMLRRWLDFCFDTGLDPWLVTRRHIEVWLATMKPSTAKAHATVVCGFYDDAHRRGYTERNLAWGVRRPRTGRPKPGTYAAPEELRRILDESESAPVDVRAVVTFLVLTGARLGETLALDVESVQHDPVRVVLERKHWHTDVITVPTLVAVALEPLLARRSTGPLFRHEGRRMPASVARRWVTELAERAGCEQHITPHSLRRSFVTFARDLGIPDVEIMAMTGHSDPTMIDYYDRGRRQRGGMAARAIDEALS